MRVGACLPCWQKGEVGSPKGEKGTSATENICPTSFPRFTASPAFRAVDRDLSLGSETAGGALGSKRSGAVRSWQVGDQCIRTPVRLN